jgi:hypothetical protein
VEKNTVLTIPPNVGPWVAMGVKKTDTPVPDKKIPSRWREIVRVLIPVPDG